MPARGTVLNEKTERDAAIPGRLKIGEPRDQDTVRGAGHQKALEDDVGRQGQRSHSGRGRAPVQCAASQLSAARASTNSGTEISTAGRAAFSITWAISLQALAVSLSGASKISSSCTCSSMVALILASASAPGRRTIARRITSAAEPWIGALMAARSAPARK